MTDTYDHRWVCRQCGDLALLDDDGRCGECQPERVAEWSVLCGWVVHGRPEGIRRRWEVR